MSINHKCGIFGVFDSEHPARDTYMALHELQHRGQEGAGITVKSKNKDAITYQNNGIVTEAFNEAGLEKIETYLDDHGFGVGHVRYSTSGGLDCVQPITKPSDPDLKQNDVLGVVHNGHLTNATILKDRYDLKNVNVDTQIIFDIVSHKLQKEGIHRSIKQTIKELRGAFSLIFLTKNGLVITRDQHGFRPLFVGNHSKQYYIASETSAFQILDASTAGEIKPGQIVTLEYRGNTIRSESERFTNDPKNGLCSFEPIYFSKPDSHYDMSSSVHEKRIEMGRALWQENPVENADLITEVPDSANSATQGVAKEADDVPYEMTILRSHYTGRTFIQPYQQLRQTKIRRKFSLIPGSVENKKVVIVDDSIVRGNTMKFITELLEKGGAKEIHLRIASPPIKNPCYYGIDIPNKNELMANQYSLETMKSILSVDSLAYLSIDQVHEILSSDHCDACFTGNYPTNTEHCLTKENNYE